MRRDGDRVGDVGLAAGAELAQVRLVGEAVGVADLLDVGGVEVVELGGQRGEAGGRGVGGRADWARPARARALARWRGGAVARTRDSCPEFSAAPRGRRAARQ